MRPTLFLASMVLPGAALISACGPAPKPPSAAQLAEWALGSDSRGDYPETTEAYLIRLPKGKAPADGARVTPKCSVMSSLLAAGDGRVYVIKNKALHVVQTSAAAPGPLPLDGDKSLRLLKLIAFRAQVSPLEILAVARPEGATANQVWSLKVSDTKQEILEAQELTDERKPKQGQELFATYESPRCQHSGKKCLTLSTDEDGGHLDIREESNGKKVELQVLDGALDVAWTKPNDASAFYVLMGCPVTPSGN